MGIPHGVLSGTAPMSMQNGAGPMQRMIPIWHSLPPGMHDAPASIQEVGTHIPDWQVATPIGLLQLVPLGTKVPVGTHIGIPGTMH